MKHLLSIESMEPDDIQKVIELGEKLKASRGKPESDGRPLEGQCWAMIFSKSSTRTRVTFEVGIRELGGSPMFLAANDIQLGRGEPIKDTARVMGRMLHGAVIRTYSQSEVEDFAKFSEIPTINALTDEEHPCQILADLLTMKEKLGSVENRKVCFVGDGDCNVAKSWIWAAKYAGFELRIASPANFQPSGEYMSRVDCGHVHLTEDVNAAADGVDVIYTDVWVSMGKEEESAFRMAQLSGYQINEELVAKASDGALVMHCLPAYRGKEITEDTFEKNARTIFDQAENRLHAQKAILTLLQS